MLNTIKLPGPRIAAVVVALSLVVSGAAVANSQIGGSDQRVAPVSEDQARADLPHIFESGSPVDFATPVPPAEAPGDPVEFGPYRIIPYGYVGTLPYEERPVPAGVQTSDLEVLRQSSLYREPDDDALPDGVVLVAADSDIYSSEHMVHLIYAIQDSNGSGAVWREDLDIWHMSLSRVPYDISVIAPQDGTVRTDIVDGLYVVVTDYGPTFSKVAVHVSDGRFNTLVESWHYPAETLIGIARSMLRR